MIIHKQVLPFFINEAIRLVVPVGAQILDYQMQHSMAVFWYMYEERTDAATEERLIFITGTGHRFIFGAPMNHVRTLQYAGHVWHIFEQAVK